MIKEKGNVKLGVKFRVVVNGEVVEEIDVGKLDLSELKCEGEGNEVIFKSGSKSSK